jgi:hypothetical protein
MNILNHKTIGKVRRFFIIEGKHLWNSWVRTATSYLG